MELEGGVDVGDSTSCRSFVAASSLFGGVAEREDVMYSCPGCKRPSERRGGQERRVLPFRAYSFDPSGGFWGRSGNGPLRSSNGPLWRRGRIRRLTDAELVRRFYAVNSVKAQDL